LTSFCPEITGLSNTFEAYATSKCVAMWPIEWQLQEIQKNQKEG